MRSSRAFFVPLLFTAFCAPLFALDPNQPLRQLHHTSWTSKDGLIGSVEALAQTADGYLWVGTSECLYRFDGLTFERYRLDRDGVTTGGISALMADIDGGLWIGYGDGGASFLDRGRLIRYLRVKDDSAVEGFPKGQVNGFARTSDGTLWVAAVGGIARLEGGHWLRVRSDRNKLLRQVGSIFPDGRGNLWIGAENKLLVLPKGETAPRETGVTGWIKSMARAPGGGIWYCGKVLFGLLPAVWPSSDKAHTPTPQIERAAVRVLVDRDGSLWVAGDGLARMPFPEQASSGRASKWNPLVETLTYPADLTDVSVRCLLEDREGNIWFGTGGGLERLRHRNLSWFGLKPGTHDYALAAGRNGEIWAWPISGRGIRVQDGKVLGAGPTDVWIAHAGGDGGVWLAALTSFWHWDGQRFLRLPSPIFPKHFLVTAITTDTEGTLWVSEMSEGVMLRRKDGGWTKKAPRGLPVGKAEAACTDYAGRVWWAYVETLAAVDHDRVVMYSAENGLDVGRISKIASRPQQVWAAGRSGLAFLLADRFYTLKIADGRSLGSVLDIVATADDGLWLSASPGIVHIPEREVQLVLRNPGAEAAVDVFDLTSDLPEALQGGKSTNSAIAQGTDGFLWFATRQGVARVDPRHILKNRLPPPVSVRSIVADGTSYSTFDEARLPPLTKDLRIDYTALSLSIPERLRFRYKLIGRDDTWQDVGGRRQAFYTNLKPKRYTFQVIACNNDGVWNEAGASWSFRVEPTFYQTAWFELFCLVIVLGFGRIVYVLRVRAATAEIQARLGERMVERERIARELHDTLLQGFHGLVLRFDAALKYVPLDGPARKMLESALDRADQVLLEGRSRVRDLRSEDPDKHDLAASFADCVAELTREGGPSFSLLTTGTPQPVDPIVQDEIYRIGREALINAFQHSSATKVEVEITYDRSRFRLRVRDDGCGIDPGILEHGRPHHWGLTGVRERAKKIGARLNIWSNAGAGTEIELLVPAQLVYRSVQHMSRWQRLKHLLRRRESGDGHTELVQSLSSKPGGSEPPEQS